MADFNKYQVDSKRKEKQKIPKIEKKTIKLNAQKSMYDVYIYIESAYINQKIRFSLLPFDLSQRYGSFWLDLRTTWVIIFISFYTFHFNRN